MKYIVSVDQSTAGTKVMLIDAQGIIRHKMSQPHTQYYPHENWIEHDGEEIWRNVCALISKIIFSNQLQPKDIDSLTISNQRETTIVWDRKTGKPIFNAIVWQCQRGIYICRELDAYKETIQEKTGLPLSPYYPAAKLAWILREIPGAYQRAKKGELCFGTIDSYLVYRLTEGKRHVTDISNAARSQLFNVKSLVWDEELLRLFDIPESILPEVVNSDGDFGEISNSMSLDGIKISAVMGDSNAGLFGHQCIQPGMAKITYGTGSSIMCNIGASYKRPPKGIVLSIAWSNQNEIQYVFEGNITSAGDTLQWIVNELQLVDTIEEIESLSRKVENTGGVYLIPAFSGLGAPYFNNKIKASIVGLNRCSSKAHVVRAALESLAYQVTDVIDIMKEECKIRHLCASGGATVNTLLMQLQADLLDISLNVTKEKELSALGVAFMGGLRTGFFNTLPEDKSITIYKPSGNDKKAEDLCEWRKIVQHALKQ